MFAHGAARTRKKKVGNKVRLPDLIAQDRDRVRQHLHYSLFVVQSLDQREMHCTKRLCLQAKAGASVQAY